MNCNLFWLWSYFFLDQTGEINLHMVFPQYQILFKCLLKTSNGDACWERWNTSPLGWKRYNTHKHWVTGLPKHCLECKCQVCYEALFAPEHNLAHQNSTLNHDPVLMFVFDLLEAQKLWRPNIMLSSVLQMAARQQSARSDLTTANKP